MVNPIGLFGWFSASTGMLLVSSVALSIMLSNDLIMPALWRLMMSRHDKRLPQMLKFTRRICILAVMLLGFLFFHFFNDIDQLSVFGLLAFSAVAQFAPALIGGCTGVVAVKASMQAYCWLFDVGLHPVVTNHFTQFAC
jgi:Na+/proline symporter